MSEQEPIVECVSCQRLRVIISAMEDVYVRARALNAVVVPRTHSDAPGRQKLIVPVDEWAAFTQSLGHAARLRGETG